MKTVIVFMAILMLLVGCDSPTAPETCKVTETYSITFSPTCRPEIKEIDIEYEGDCDVEAVSEASVDLINEIHGQRCVMGKVVLGDTVNIDAFLQGLY